MSSEFNPEMLNIARDLLAMSQAELAKVTGIHTASLSRYESGLVPIPKDELRIVAKALDFPVEFFYRKGDRHNVESGEVFHRKRSSVPMKKLRKLYATLDLFRLNLEILLMQVEVEPPYTIPNYRLQHNRIDIAEIARLVRGYWNLPPGHIRNLIESMENAFCMIFPLDFGTDKIDEVTQWVEPMPPIMLVNTRAPGDRLRWSIAHALGHLVMHHGMKQYLEMEREADQFAAAFLMPANDIKSELKPTTLEHLLGLKPLWKVSVQALINRARDLNVITETKHRSLYQTLSRKGWRTNEPFPLPAERPSLFPQLLSLYQDDRRYSTSEIADLLNVSTHHIQAWYLPPKPALRLVPKRNEKESTG
jgi:Zn-dependent peptidase ImmA (M78 family)/DNA-binding XRE family transcriptional regulator